MNSWCGNPPYSHSYTRPKSHEWFESALTATAPYSDYFVENFFPRTARVFGVNRRLETAKELAIHSGAKQRLWSNSGQPRQLSGVKRTRLPQTGAAAYDPKRTHSSTIGQAIRALPSVRQWPLLWLSRKAYHGRSRAGAGAMHSNHSVLRLLIAVETYDRIYLNRMRETLVLDCVALLSSHCAFD